MSYKTTISIYNKLGAREASEAEMEVEVELDYTIHEGQEAILYRDPGSCQPGYEPEIEIDLIKANIYEWYEFGEDSIWWPVIEASARGSDRIYEEILKYEEKQQNEW